MFKKIRLSALSSIFLLLFSLPVSGGANPLFGYTHLLSSPLTLPAGRFMLGTTVGVGVTSFLEIDSDILANIFQIYNVQARFSVLDFPKFALGLSLGYQFVNLNSLASQNPSLNVSAFLPGAVVGIEIVPNLALFLGGQLFYPNVSLPGAAIGIAGFLQGAEVESDVSWAYNPDHGRIVNAFSLGASYNITFAFYGVGISHHWPGFHLGFHYYPNAATFPVVPILGGGASFDL